MLTGQAGQKRHVAFLGLVDVVNGDACKTRIDAWRVAMICGDCAHDVADGSVVPGFGLWTAKFAGHIRCLGRNAHGGRRRAQFDFVHDVGAHLHQAGLLVTHVRFEYCADLREFGHGSVISAAVVQGEPEFVGLHTGLINDHHLDQPVLDCFGDLNTVGIDSKLWTHGL